MDRVRVLVDLMGADREPQVLAAGAFDAAQRHPDLLISLLTTPEFQNGLTPPDSVKDRIRWIAAEQTITMEDQPLIAIRRKPNATLVTGMRLLAAGEADAFVSAGNTGAAVAAATVYLGCLPPITRPALGIVLPRKAGQVLLLDVGANVDCKPEHFLQFAVMGSCYLRAVFGIPQPSVALLNIGEEAVKGSASAKEAYHLLQSAPIRFVGNIEGRDIFNGNVDVVVTDGFVGNIVLKSAEGVGFFLWQEIRKMFQSHLIGKVASLFLSPLFQKLSRRLDWREYGGAPLLGVRGLCIIAHGSSDSKAFSRAITAARQNVLRKTVPLVEESLRQISSFLTMKG
ncbi:MAG: phosphate acyltransferase PlsX [Armatimonadetes bacterium]|nr:phosphate acyltransferase PlsX [Armatimonadota bacterium]